ncbi:hypothetical protein [Bacteroides fragilis]|nr:hypothetical protein [Bacteroides fragilis]QCQ52664.1 hypothetical protein EC81_001890 [Bacteroides fragilis]
MNSKKSDNTAIWRLKVCRMAQNSTEMNKYTIRYYYGSYSGIREVYADDEETAITYMWRMLRKDMTLPVAYQSEEIIDVEYDAD